MTKTSNPNNWFVCPQPSPGADTRLFLFPYAGGGPAIFGQWPGKLPRNIESWAAHYPGRGSRHNEPPINRVITLAEKLSQAIQPLLDKPFAFFGHSLGALVAFELTRRLRQQDFPQPCLLFVSACSTPGMPAQHPIIHNLPDPEFLHALQNFNGIPGEVIHLPELFKLLLPTLRADFEAVECYDFTPIKYALNCPIIAYGGLGDPHVSSAHLEGWAAHTEAGFEVHYFPGDHFFINTSRDAVLASISEQLNPGKLMRR